MLLPCCAQRKSLVSQLQRLDATERAVLGDMRAEQEQFQQASQQASSHSAALEEQQERAVQEARAQLQRAKQVGAWGADVAQQAAGTVARTVWVEWL